MLKPAIYGTRSIIPSQVGCRKEDSGYFHSNAVYSTDISGSPGWGQEALGTLVTELEPHRRDTDHKQAIKFLTETEKF